MKHWIYKPVTGIWWEPSKKHLQENMQHCLITFKVRSVTNSRNGATGAARGGVKSQHRGWGRAGRAGEGGPVRCPDYNRMSSHNKACIISSWRVATVWELYAAIFSAKCWKNVSQLCSWSGARTTTNPVWVSACIKQLVFQEAETPTLHCFPPLWLLLLQVQPGTVFLQLGVLITCEEVTPRTTILTGAHIQNTNDYMIAERLQLYSESTWQTESVVSLLLINWGHSQPQRKKRARDPTQDIIILSFIHVLQSSCHW